MIEKIINCSMHFSSVIQNQSSTPSNKLSLLLLLFSSLLFSLSLSLLSLFFSFLFLFIRTKTRRFILLSIRQQFQHRKNWWNETTIVYLIEMSFDGLKNQRSIVFNCVNEEKDVARVFIRPLAIGSNWCWLRIRLIQPVENQKIIKLFSTHCWSYHQIWLRAIDWVRHKF